MYNEFLALQCQLSYNLNDRIVCEKNSPTLSNLKEEEEEEPFYKTQEKGKSRRQRWFPRSHRQFRFQTANTIPRVYSQLKARFFGYWIKNGGNNDLQTGCTRLQAKKIGKNGQPADQAYSRSNEINGCLFVPEPGKSPSLFVRVSKHRHYTRRRKRKEGGKIRSSVPPFLHSWRPVCPKNHLLKLPPRFQSLATPYPFRVYKRDLQMLGQSSRPIHSKLPIRNIVRLTIQPGIFVTCPLRCCCCSNPFDFDTKMVRKIVNFIINFLNIHDLINQVNKFWNIVILFAINRNVYYPSERLFYLAFIRSLFSSTVSTNYRFWSSSNWGTLLEVSHVTASWTTWQITNTRRMLSPWRKHGGSSS